jgi:hypothetical protein
MISPHSGLHDVRLCMPGHGRNWQVAHLVDTRAGVLPAAPGMPSAWAA